MPTVNSFRFSVFTLDTARASLLGPAGPIDLRRKSFDVLRYLAERPDRIVTKDELLEAIWPGVIVGEDSLSQCISDIRKALGPLAREIIKTVPRRGYILSISTSKSDDGSERTFEESGPGRRDNADRPSIAVLPFSYFGSDIAHEYLADGITEDITTELSRFSELLVIARNSSFQYKGKATDVRRIGRELSVDYVLEGSVRHEAGKVRITAQLVEAADGMHRWAERYDRTLEDVLAVQDELARAIVAVLAVHVAKAERDRILLKPPSAWQAYDHYLRAAECIAHYHSSYDKGSLINARRLLKQALLIDPDYARAHAGLSNVYMSFWVHRWDDECSWSESLDRSYRSAIDAVRLGPNLPEAHIALGQSLTFLRQHEAAVAAVERAIQLNPNLTSFRFSYILVLAGEAERAVELLQSHMRLDPFYQPNAPVALAYAHYMLEQYEEALPHLLEAAARAPKMAHCRYVLAMTYAQLGRIDEAKHEVAHALRLEPWYKISNSLTAAYFRYPEDREHLVDGLRKAGFPD